MSIAPTETAQEIMAYEPQVGGSVMTMSFPVMAGVHHGHESVNVEFTYANHHSHEEIHFGWKTTIDMLNTIVQAFNQAEGDVYKQWRIIFDLSPVGRVTRGS